jgi:hypothetical protein
MKDTETRQKPSTLGRKSEEQDGAQSLMFFTHSD